MKFKNQQKYYVAKPNDISPYTYTSKEVGCIVLVNIKFSLYSCFDRSQISPEVKMYLTVYKTELPINTGNIIRLFELNLMF